MFIDTPSVMRTPDVVSDYDKGTFSCDEPDYLMRAVRSSTSRLDLDRSSSGNLLSHAALVRPLLDKLNHVIVRDLLVGPACSASWGALRQRQRLLLRLILRLFQLQRGMSLRVVVVDLLHMLELRQNLLRVSYRQTATRHRRRRLEKRRSSQTSRIPVHTTSRTTMRNSALSNMPTPLQASNFSVLRPRGPPRFLEAFRSL